MEPLKVIYDGYEIEIRSGGDSMPIVTMKKIETNTINENTIKKYLEDYMKTPPYKGWWENPPMWLNPNITMEFTNKDSLYYPYYTSTGGNHEQS